MYSINIPFFIKYIIMQVYEGEITDWNWIGDYGIATITSGPLTGNDVFIMAQTV